MPNDAPTVPYRSSLMRVVIAHESPRPCFALADVLRGRYIVRMVHTLGELDEQLGVVDRVACVVCLSGPKLRARDVRDQALRLGVAPGRVVVLGHEDLEPVERAVAEIRAAIESSNPSPRLAS